MKEYNIESDFELMYEKSSELENEKREVTDNIKKINDAASLVLNDQALQKILKNLKDNQACKLGLIAEEKKRLFEKVRDWAKCVGEANEQNHESYQVVQELKSVGLSIDDACALCEERQQLIDENINMISEILKLLGEDFEDSGIKKKNLVKTKTYTPASRKGR